MSAGGASLGGDLLAERRALTHLIHVYGYWIVFGLVAIESLGVPVPGESALVAAAIYAGTTHHLNIAWVVTAAAAGAVTGDNIGYLLGHWGGYRLLLRFGHYVRLDQTRIKVARYLFHRYGPEVVFFGRFVSILRTYAAFLAGTTRMVWRLFLIFNAAGGVTWACLYGIGAFYLGKELDRLARPFAFGIGVAAVILIAAGILLIRNQEKRLEQAAERTFPGPIEGYREG